MNRIYRVIRSRTYGRDVVVSEITKTSGKSKRDVHTQVHKKRFFKSWLSGLATAIFLALPVSVIASEITDLNGNSLINTAHTTHNLYAQQINSSNKIGKVGVSKYGKFNVTANDVANLHFNQKGGTDYADSLVNLVKSKININGTVNALKGNKVGGHLYFLSPEGMAVGKSGVINAGQFTSVVPSTKLFDKLTNNNANTFNEYFYDYVMEKGKIEDLSDWYSYDNDKNINIEGKINTRSGIKLRASKIDIAQGAKLLSNQAIDFTSLVNTTDFGDAPDVQMNASTDDKTGDIVLTAALPSDEDSGIPHSSALGNQDLTIRSASINVYGQVESDGDVTATLQKGDIHIGDTGDGVDTVAAGGNVSLSTALGHVQISGGVTTAGGDISIAGAAESYAIPGQSNFTINQNGHIASARDLTLIGNNGDIHPSNKTSAERNLTATIQAQGSIYFDNACDVPGNLVLGTESGDINIGKDLKSTSGNITMMVAKGGNVRVDEKVTSEQGGVTIQTQAGDIHIGDNGENVNTVLSNGNVSLSTALGHVQISGGVTTAGGDITVLAKSMEYTPGTENILVGNHGKLHAAGYVNLTSENGDISLTDKILSGDGIALTTNNGNITIGRDVDVKNEVLIQANNGDIQAVGNLVAGNSVKATSQAGSLTILGGVTSKEGDVTLTGDEAITVNKAINSKKAITIQSDEGAITLGGVTSEEGDVTLTSDGDITVKQAINSRKAITIQSDKRAITLGGVTSEEGDVTLTSNRNITVNQAINSKKAITIQSDKGDIKTAALSAEEGTVHVKAKTGGDINLGGKTTGTDVTVDTLSGSITTTGLISTSGHVSLTTGDGNIQVNSQVKSSAGDVTVQTGKGDIHIGDTGDGVDTVAAGGNVSLSTALGHVQISGGVTTAGGDITVLAKSAEYTPGTENILVRDHGRLHAAGYLNLTSENGDINLTDGMRSGDGIALTTDTGNITIARDVEVENKVLLQANKSGDILSKGNLVGPNSVKVNALAGSITILGEVISTNGDVSLTSDGAGQNGGDVILEGITRSANDLVTTAKGGSVNFNAAVTAGNAITAEAGKDVNINAVIQATGNVSAKAHGSVLEDKNQGTVLAQSVATQTGGTVDLQSQGNNFSSFTGSGIDEKTINGNVSVQSVAKALSVAFDAAVNGDIAITGLGTDGLAVTSDLTANASASDSSDGNIFLQGMGSITTAPDTTLASAADTVLVSQEGNIVLNGGVAAGYDLVATADEGDVTFNAATQADHAMTLTALGEVSDGDTGFLVTQALTTKTGGSVTLDNSANAFTRYTANSFNKNGIAGDIVVKADGGQTFDVAINPTVSGTVDVANLAEGGTLALTTAVTAQNVTLTSDATLKTAMAINAERMTTLISEQGGIVFDSEVSAGTDLKALAAGDITFDANATAGTGTITVDAGDNILINATLTAEKGSVNAKAGKEINDGETGALVTQSLTTETGGSVTLDNEANAFSSYTAKGLDDNAIAGNILVDANTGGVFTVAIMPTVSGDVTVTNLKENGSLVLDTGITAQNVTLESDASITTTDNTAIKSTAHTILASRTGNVMINGGVEAGNDLIATATAGQVVFNTAVQAGHDITAEASQDVTVNAALTAESVTATAGGMVKETSNGAITADAVITYTGQGVDLVGNEKNAFNHFTADALKGSDAIAGDVLVTTQSENLTAKIMAPVNGNVALTNKADEGALILSDPVTVNGSNESEGHLILTAGGDIHTDSSIQAVSDIQFISTAGGITVGSDTGDSTVSTQGSVLAWTGQGAVAFNSAVLAQYGGLAALVTEDGSISFAGDIDVGTDVLAIVDSTGNIQVEGLINADGQVALSTGSGDIGVGGDINADQAVSLQSAGSGNLTVDGLVSGTAVTIETDDGDIAIDQVAGADVSIQAGTGDITVVQSVKATDGNVLVETGAGDITIGQDAEGQSVSATGNATLTTSSGQVDLDGSVNSGGNVTLEATDGSIHVDGDVSTQQDLTVTTQQQGNIVLDGNIEVAGQSVMRADAGDIGFKGDVVSKGDMEATTDSGNITTDGKVSGTSVAINAAQGNVTVGDDVASIVGDIVLTASDAGDDDEVGNITVAGKLDSAKNVSLTAVNGLIETQDMLEAKGDVEAIAKGNGNITLGSNTAAGQDIKAVTDYGSITVTGDLEGGRDLLLTVNQSGDIKADNLVATRDAIITNNGKGSIEVAGITAGNLVDVELTEGDMHIGNATGNRVILLAGNNSEESHIGTVTANANGNTLGTDPADVILGGNNVNVDTIQKGTGDVPLTISTHGAALDQPIQDMTIDSLMSDTGNVLQNVWVVDGNIHVDQGKLDISKAYAINKLHVDNEKASFALYGSEPRYSGETLIIWNNPEKNRPSDYLNEWYDGASSNNRWVFMVLDEQGHLRAGNGVLVNNQNVDIGVWRLDTDMFGDWYDISYYDRYVLVESDDESEKHAARGEITVE